MRLKDILKDTDLYKWYSSIKFLKKAKIIKNITAFDYVSNKFFKAKGKVLDLQNPSSFDEKLCKDIIEDNDPLKTYCTDKITARNYVSKCGFGDILIEPFYAFKNVHDIKKLIFRSDNFIVKCNHISGAAVIVHKGKHLSILAKKYFSNMQKINYYDLSKENNYKNIKPRIIAEKLLSDNGNLPTDYKIFTFNGVAHFVTVDSGVITKNGNHAEKYFRNFFDRDFKPIYNASDSGRQPRDWNTIKKPKNWDYMVKISETLSKPFRFCRIDLYNIDGQVYFGEMTFYHGGGINNFKPSEFEAKICSFYE